MIILAEEIEYYKIEENKEREGLMREIKLDTV